MSTQNPFTDLTQTGSPVDFSKLREIYKRNIMKVVNKLKGRKKTLIMDPKVSGVLNQCIQTSTLKQHGIDQLYYLEPGGELDASVDDVVFFCRPRYEMMKTIAEHVLNLRDARRQLIKEVRKQEQTDEKCSFDIDEHPDVAPLPTMTVCMVPRVTSLCMKFLDNLGILDIVKLRQCDINFLPIEPDVLTLEYESAYREIACEGHNMPAYYVASALHKLQRDIIGLVPLVKGKGRLAKDVSEIMLRLRREAIVEGEVDMIEPGEEAGESLVDAIVLLDREVDTITPFCTQLTYEGLTDEILGMKNGVVTIKLKSGDDEEYAASSEDEEGKTPTKVIKSRLSSNDVLFKEIRDLNFGKACSVLRDRSTEMQAHYQALKEGKVEDQNVSEIGDFVRKLKGNIGGAGLDLHSTLAKTLLDKSKSYFFRQKLEMERHCIEGGSIDAVISQIEEMIYRGESWEMAMKLACLASQTYGGLPEKKFDSIRTDVMHAYGAVGILNSIVLERAGLFYGKESSAEDPNRLAYQNVKKPMKLVVDSVSEESSNDITFAYSSSGYAPLSIRLVQLAIRGSWKHHEETLKHLRGGESFELGQSLNEYGGAVQTSANYHSLLKKISLAKDKKSSLDISGYKKKPVVLVCFIGGVTSAEISCLRQMSKSSEVGVDFIVATTKVITGENLLRNMNQKEDLGIYDESDGDRGVPWSILKTR